MQCLLHPLRAALRNFSFSTAVLGCHGSGALHLWSCSGRLYVDFSRAHFNVERRMDAVEHIHVLLMPPKATQPVLFLRHLLRLLSLCSVCRSEAALYAALVCGRHRKRLNWLLTLPQRHTQSVILPCELLCSALEKRQPGFEFHQKRQSARTHGLLCGLCARGFECRLCSPCASFLNRGLGNLQDNACLVEGFKLLYQ
jgi:hypothetical protein